MGVGPENRSAKSVSERLIRASLVLCVEPDIKIMKSTHLFIDRNLAKACDMAYISPEAWRKYLWKTRGLVQECTNETGMYWQIYR